MALQTRQKKRLIKDKCAYCLVTSDLTIDHKIPIVQGGTDDVKNLQTLCQRCNGMKSGMSHKQLKNIFHLHREINYKRELKGKKPL